MRFPAGRVGPKQDHGTRISAVPARLSPVNGLEEELRRIVRDEMAQERGRYVEDRWLSPVTQTHRSRSRSTPV